MDISSYFKAFIACRVRSKYSPHGIEATIQHQRPLRRKTDGLALGDS